MSTHIDGLLQQSPKRRSRDELKATLDARRNLNQELVTPNERNNKKYKK